MHRECCDLGVYTEDGQLISRLSVNSRSLSMASYIASTEQTVVVSDSGNHCVKLFDLASGLQTSVVGRGRGADYGCLEWPQGVCIDWRGDVVVADRCNRRVSVFDRRTGKFRRHLLDDVPSPMALRFDDRRRLLAVTHYARSGYSQCTVYDVSQC